MESSYFEPAFKDSGASHRQLERLTGVGRGLI